MRVVLLTALLAATFSLPVCAQDSSTSSSSSSSSEYFRGYGGTAANVFNAKYKERLKNWREQIELGLSRGFLQPSDGDKYKSWLDQLTAEDAALSAKGYPKAETDDMEQKFNAFNVDLTNAMQPKPQPAPKTTPAATTPAPAGTTPAPAATTPPSTVPAKAPPAVKPAAKSPIPAAAVKRKPPVVVKAKAKAKSKRR